MTHQEIEEQIDKVFNAAKSAKEVFEDMRHQALKAPLNRSGAEAEAKAIVYHTIDPLDLMKEIMYRIQMYHNRLPGHSIANLDLLTYEEDKQ